MTPKRLLESNRGGSGNKKKRNKIKNKRLNEYKCVDSFIGDCGEKKSNG